MSEAARPIRIDRLVRSRRRSIGLEVTREGALVVRAPHGVSEPDIRRVIDDKSRWIRNTVEKLLRQAPRSAPKRFAAGEAFVLLGREYALRYDEGSPAGFVEFSEERGFALAPGDAANAAALLEDWYRWRAIKIFRGNCDRRAAQMDVAYGGLRLTDAKRRWGSCGTGADIRLNWRLVMAPEPVIDYVVVHELAHIKRLDHSRHFWRVVEAAMPDWREKRAWLRENDATLSWNIERENG